MNVNDEKNGNCGAQGGGDYKLEITDYKDGNDGAMAVGDAAVTVVADEVGDVGNEQKRAGVKMRRKVVRRSGGVLTGRKRWGKIARMPLEIREWLNEQVRDGVRYAEISAGLAQRGFVGVTKFDLSDWRRGGHQEWLLEQERIAALRTDVGRVVKAVESFSEKEEEGVERLNEMLIGMQIVNALQDLHRGTLKTLVATKPELLFRLARVASDQARDRARRKRVNLVVRKYEERAARKKAKLEDKPGLTPETLAKVERELARIL